MFKVVRRRRVVIASGAAVTLLAGLTLWGAVEAVASGPAPAASGDRLRAAASEVSAVAGARATGHQVEVEAFRSETGEVFANPDGTFTAVEHVRQVRTRMEGRWVGINATLQGQPDGRVAPVSSSVQISLSGGGSGPLARLSLGGRVLSLAWPGNVPAPELDGDTAVYPDVFPGVDLRARADGEGFSHILVVKTRQAAANPALHALRLGLDGSTLTVRAAGGGSRRSTPQVGVRYSRRLRRSCGTRRPVPPAAWRSRPGSRAQTRT
jgi:hypothetical protein